MIRFGKLGMAFKAYCTTINRCPVFTTRYSVINKVYTGYHGEREIQHDLRACTVDNPFDKARELSLRTGAETMLYFSLKSCFIFKLTIQTVVLTVFKCRKM